MELDTNFKTKRKELYNEIKHNTLAYLFAAYSAYSAYAAYGAYVPFDEVQESAFIISSDHWNVGLARNKGIIIWQQVATTADTAQSDSASYQRKSRKNGFVSWLM